MIIWNFLFILVQKIFNVIIECLPSNCYHSVCKIKENKQFADVNDEIDDVLINCEKNDVVTEQLLWYMYKKCDYDFLKLKGILENIFPRHSLLTSANINSQLNRGKHTLNEYIFVLYTEL